MLIKINLKNTRDIRVGRRIEFLKLLDSIKQMREGKGFVLTSRDHSLSLSKASAVKRGVCSMSAVSTCEICQEDDDDDMMRMGMMILMMGVGMGWIFHHKVAL